MFRLNKHQINGRCENENKNAKNANEKNARKCFTWKRVCIFFVCLFHRLFGYADAEILQMWVYGFIFVRFQFKACYIS